MRIVGDADNVSGLTDAEDLTLETMDAGEDRRLRCMAKVPGDVVVEIATNG